MVLFQPSAVFLVYRGNTYLVKYVELMRTINFRFHLSHGGVRFKCGVVSVKDASHARRTKATASQKWLKK